MKKASGFQLCFLGILLPFLLLMLSCQKPSVTDFVDPMIGTGGHGHTFPGATVPFGMVQLSPDTRLTGWDGCSGYHNSDSVIYGFSHTHLSGTGVSDYGDILLMPFCGQNTFSNGSGGEEGYASFFRKESEKAQAGYYEVLLEKDRILTQLSSSKRVGFHRYTFLKKKNRKLILDLQHRDELSDHLIEYVDDRQLAGYRHSRAWAEQQMLFYHMAFSDPLDSMLFNTDSSKVILFFGEGDELKVKVALSAVDQSGALKNLEQEIPHWDFELVQSEAKASWDAQLSKIQVKGGSQEQKVIFYTALYHTMIAPNLYQDVDGRFRATDLEIYQSQNHTHYSVFSLWDTYRATHPLYTLIEQERTKDFIQTFLKQYEEGGRLPMWELSANYTGCMIGYHAVPVIADAFLKGIDGFDTDLALEAMVHSARQSRLGISEFAERGFIASENESESVSKTLEYAYDDWCIARMAEKLGYSETSQEFDLRALQYQNVFDASTGCMRARQNNSWWSPFDPSEVNFNYTEANAWQYSFYMPHDIEGWTQLMGGEQQAIEQLDRLFSASSETKGRVQADITGLIGQYAHGNEPSHHIPYLYSYLGAAHKTQERVRQIMAEMYAHAPDGLSGNEDCGQMSAWYVLSAMGFYSVCPGSTQYVLGSPIFDEIIFHFENGQTFTIQVENNSQQNMYIQNASLNDQPYGKGYIDHREIMHGGTLRIEMGSKPSSYASEKINRPTSSVKASFLPIPALVKGAHSFVDSTMIQISCADSGATIYYSFSEQDTIGDVYVKPFTLRQSTSLYTWAAKGKTRSKIGISQHFQRSAKRGIDLNTQYAPQYSGGGNEALIDQLKGGEDFRTGLWQGYQGVDLNATIDLGEVERVNQIGLNCLQDQNSWIFMPESISLLGSLDGQEFQLIKEVQHSISPLAEGVIVETFSADVHQEWRYIRVIARNRGECPPQHKGAGHQAWIFADEIMIQ